MHFAPRHLLSMLSKTFFNPFDLEFVYFFRGRHFNACNKCIVWNCLWRHVYFSTEHFTPSFPRRGRIVPWPRQRHDPSIEWRMWRYRIQTWLHLRTAVNTHETGVGGGQDDYKKWMIYLSYKWFCWGRYNTAEMWNYLVHDGQLVWEKERESASYALGLGLSFCISRTLKYTERFWNYCQTG